MSGSDISDGLKDDVCTHIGVSRDMAQHLLNCPSLQIVVVLRYNRVFRQSEEEVLVAFRDFAPFAIAHLQVGPAPETGTKLQELGPGLYALPPMLGILQGGSHLSFKTVHVLTHCGSWDRPAVCRLCRCRCVKTRPEFPACRSDNKTCLQKLVGLCSRPIVGASHWTLTLASP